MLSPVEEIKTRLNIVDFIREYVKLDKAGVNFKARCPFHSERTPSFYVSPAREIWHCFGCGKGGDIFQFIMEMEGLDFPEALRILADKAGVTVKQRDAAENSQKARLLELLDAAASFYEEHLENSADVAAYLKQRGLTGGTIKEFRLGFASGSWDGLYRHMRKKGFADADLEKAGLMLKSPRNAPFDRFRSRIMFPLEDSLGRVIGFGGRIFEPEQAPARDRSVSGNIAKYINSPQTVLYDKSRYLFGFNRSKSDIRKHGKVVLVEGYMDVMMSHQAGIKNAVAVSGTALTGDHLHALGKLTDTLCLSFDMDEAGIAAARRAAERALETGFNVKLITLPRGNDPADLVKVGAEAWIQAVNNASECIDFFLKRSVERFGTRDAASKKAVGDDVLPFMSRLPNEIEKAHWVGELSRALVISEEALWRALGKYGSAVGGDVSSPRPVFIENSPKSRKALLEERLAGLIILDPSLIQSFEILPCHGDCALASTAVIFDAIRERGIDADTRGKFIASLPEDVKKDASRILFEVEVLAENISDVAAEIDDVLNFWQEENFKEQLKAVAARLQNAEGAGKKDENELLLKQFGELTKALADHNAKKENNKKEKTNRF